MKLQAIPVLLFGVGGIGRHHLRLLRANPKILLLGVVDPTLPVIEGVRSFASLEAFEKARATEESLAPRAVVLATPIATHYELAKHFLQQGVHVFVEKPMVTHATQAEELTELAHKQGCAFMVGHSERFNPAFVAFMAEFRKGIVGQVYRIECNRTGPFPQRIGDSGATIDLAVHDLDSLNALFGNEAPKWVFAKTEKRIHPTQEDGLNAMLGYASEIVVQMTVNWLSPRKNRLLHVYGYKGMLQCDFFLQKVTFFENLYQRSRPDEYGIGGIEVGPETEFAVEKWEPLAREHELFFTLVSQGMNAEGSANVASAALAVKIAEELLRSAQKNQPMEWVP